MNNDSALREIHQILGGLLNPRVTATRVSAQPVPDSTAPPPPPTTFWMDSMDALVAYLEANPDDKAEVVAAFTTRIDEVDFGDTGDPPPPPPPPPTGEFELPEGFVVGQNAPTIRYYNEAVIFGNAYSESGTNRSGDRFLWFGRGGYPTGVYKAVWDSGSAPTITGADVQVTGDTTADVIISSATPQGIRFNTVPEGLRVWHPGYEDGSRLVHDNFVNICSKFPIIRQMNIMGSNFDPVKSASDPLPDPLAPQTQDVGSSSKMVAPEVLAELHNRSGSILWATTGHGWDIGYLERYASRLHDLYDPTLPILVEWGNEPWNTALPAGKFVREQSQANGQKASEFSAQQALPTFELFEEIFGAERVKRVFAGVSSIPTWVDAGLEYLNGEIDILATNGYFKPVNKSAVVDAESLIAESYNAYEAILKGGWQACVDRAEQWRQTSGRDIKAAVYEGGKDWTRISYRNAAQNLPEYETLLRYYLDKAEEIGISIFCAFSLIGTETDANWGHLTAWNTGFNFPPMRALLNKIDGLPVGSTRL